MVESKFIGCLLGGAIGDALGYPIKYSSIEQIKKQYGNRGLTNLVIDSEIGKGVISSDTQMTLFTAEGLIWADFRRKKRGTASVSACCFCSYQRWLASQGYELSDPSYAWLLDESRLEFLSPLSNQDKLLVRRDPEQVTIEALRQMKNQDYGTIEVPQNCFLSSGCITRIAPIGLFYHTNPKEAFLIGCEVAAITHGSYVGYLSAGMFCAIVAYLCQEYSLTAAIEKSIKLLKQFYGHDQVTNLVEQAVELSKRQPNYETIESLGSGKTAAEALAIAIYCALSYPEDYKKAVLFSIHHSGLSNVTGSLCGTLMGTYLGEEKLDSTWKETVEQKPLIEQIGKQLYSIAKIEKM